MGLSASKYLRMGGIEGVLEWLEACFRFLGLGGGCPFLGEGSKGGDHSQVSQFETLIKVGKLNKDLNFPFLDCNNFQMFDCNSFR